MRPLRERATDGRFGAVLGNHLQRHHRHERQQRETERVAI
jgi:hypothetical protein